MPDRDDLRTNPRETPLVGRPRGAAWRALQADGVVWEGQVYLVGDDVDLAARMIVTHRSVAFARGGTIVLDIPRAWLRPAPMLKWDGTVVLSISAPGSTPYSERDTLPIRMRDGHPAAGHVIAMFAGNGARRMPADAPPGDDFARAMLPPLPQASIPAALPERVRSNGAATNIFDDPDVFPGRAPDPARSFGTTNGSRPQAASAANGLDPVIRQPAAPVSTASQRDWNLQPPLLANHLVPRSHRRNRWTWALRLGGLVGLLAAAALFGTGHIPTDFGGSRAAPPALPSATASSRSTQAPSAADLPPTTAASLAANQTAVALGVGGPDAEPTVALQPIVPTFPPAPSANASHGADVAAAVPTVAVPKPTPPAPTATSEPPPTQPPAAAAAPANDKLALSVETATRGNTLPQFGLPPSADGDWLPLIVAVTNQGSAPAQFAMNQAQLRSQPGGGVSPLDSGSGVIAGLVGIDPALGPNDVLSLAPGETKKVLLLFVVPPSSDQYVLQFGPTTVDLGAIH